jgi:hypothetical protein
MINPNLKCPISGDLPSFARWAKNAPRSPSPPSFQLFLEQTRPHFAYFRAFVHFRIAQPALNLAFPAIRFLSFLPAGKTQNSPL